MQITYETWQLINYLWMAVAAIVFIVLLRITAPYGRHTSNRWGPLLNNKMGWLLMERPVIVVLLFFVVPEASRQTWVSWLLIGLFLFHYLNRTFIFPLRLRTRRKKMPILIVLMAVVFNLANGTLLGTWFAEWGDFSRLDVASARFILGALLFILGVWINWDYDNRLIHLRKPGETGYKIPKGGLFNRVSCPNLLGEIIEWGGFALISWNLAALSFFIWTLANLLPRALSHHKWYKTHFSDYPKSRKAIVPYIL